MSTINKKTDTTKNEVTLEQFKDCLEQGGTIIMSNKYLTRHYYIKEEILYYKEYLGNDYTGTEQSGINKHITPIKYLYSISKKYDTSLDYTPIMKSDINKLLSE